MNNLYLEASPSSPEVDFRFDAHALSLKGESYPENAASYWGAIIASVREYLEQKSCSNPIVLDVALSYFNSSSTKMLFALFDLLNEKAASGQQVVLNWHYDADDDTIYEFGQELQEDFAALTFNNHVINKDGSH